MSIGTKHKFRRFGTGIYTTACSSSKSLGLDSVKIVDRHLGFSEADDYSLNGDEDSRFRVLLVSRVIVGNPHKRRYNSTSMTEPPCGHHSVSYRYLLILGLSKLNRKSSGYWRTGRGS